MLDSNIEDRELITRLKSGDLGALGDLYSRYRHQIYRTALAITHETAAAEDILQECFLRVYTYADRIDETLPLSPWLYRVTVNLSYTWTKRHQRHRISIDNFIDRLISPPRQAPESAAEHTELRETIHEAIDSLPFGQRVVIVLHYLNGMSLAEIAEVLDCPVGTVKSRLYHARQNLKEKLEQAAWVSDVVHGYT
jgi:RNA polymerase sigma-70 factor (ECF subfamily)